VYISPVCKQLIGIGVWERRRFMAMAKTKSWFASCILCFVFGQEGIVVWIRDSFFINDYDDVGGASIGIIEVFSRIVVVFFFACDVVIL